MKAIIKSILVLSFLIFSTSSFAKNTCYASGWHTERIFIPKEGYTRYRNVQPFLSEEHVNRFVEPMVDGAKKKALEVFQDRKNEEEERFPKFCPEGFEAKIEWSDENEFKATSVSVAAKGFSHLCEQTYSNRGSLEELEECLEDGNDSVLPIDDLIVRATISLSVSYYAYCEVTCVRNENQSDDDETYSQPEDEGINLKF